jgi:nucleotide-binding universal stress UspA family protein
VKYLVPFDFTPITRTALDHALFFSNTDNGKIELLHIIDKESKRPEAIENFTKLFNQLDSGAKAKTSFKVRVGDIYKDIANEANEGQFQLLVMGTHGAKGLQKLLGSNAIKVITSAQTPFVVTQKEGPKKSIKRIVLPIDLTAERLQIANFASNLAQKFKAEVHLVHAVENDEFLAKQMKRNVIKVKRIFEQKDVRYTIAAINAAKNLTETVIEYGREHEADLFAIGYYPATLLPQFESFSQNLITNPLGIPVLIANVEELGGVNSNYSFIGI